ncbi:Protein of unknown function [Lactobacillus delbrueckii subsp. lactis]|nr:Protein of unknown function [Lactobacillus delbrueckii subsp. lactis]
MKFQENSASETGTSALAATQKEALQSMPTNFWQPGQPGDC